MVYLDQFKVEQINMITNDFDHVNTNISNINSLIKQIQNELNTNDTLLENKIKMNTDDIEQFRLKILKPSQDLEDKLHNHDDKISDIENNAIRNGVVLRDIIKKLIYTIETSFIAGKNQDKFKSEHDLNTSNNLSLLSFSSPINFKSEKDIFKSQQDVTVSKEIKEDLESVFLKRLNFLKTLLDDEIVSSNNKNYLYDISKLKNRDLIRSGRIVLNTPQNNDN